MIRSIAVPVVLSVILFGQAAAAQDSSAGDEPAISGYITRSVSRSDFDVNGLHINSRPATIFMQSSGSDASSPRVSGGDVFLGEHVAIYGKMDSRRESIKADKVVFYKPMPETLSGLAVVDRILSPAISGNVLIRADGYPIQISASTDVALTAPLHTLADIKPGTWITYHGTRGSDGMLAADRIRFWTNSVSDKEQKFVKKSEYDPSVVPPDTKQSKTNKFFRGVNPKEIPPYHDAAMQAKIDHIGSNLVPAYQRSLPQDDPAKIHFQFQLIDAPKFRDALSLPSGVILIPYQILAKFQNDDQIAALLADHIARTLEKQTYRMVPAQQGMQAANVAGLFVPGVNILMDVSTHTANKSINTDLADQSGRVSLCLLHDMGYDIQQAPIAWWILESKSSTSLAKRAPLRVIRLYRTMGLVWKNPQMIGPHGTPLSN